MNVLEENIELVIFDCDGVLIDSELISGKVLIGMLRRLGISIDYNYFHENFVGRSFPKVAETIKSQFDVAFPVSFEQEYRRNLLKAFEYELDVITGVETILNDLSVRKCVATSSSPERVSRCLEICKLDSVFGRNVFTASEVANGKPAPDIFLHAAKKMNVKPENCLVIEDSFTGLTGAKSAEMHVLWFTGGSHFEKIDRNLPAEHKDISSFGEWGDFFEILPNLKKVKLN